MIYDFHIVVSNDHVIGFLLGFCFSAAVSLFLYSIDR